MFQPSSTATFTFRPVLTMLWANFVQGKKVDVTLAGAGAASGTVTINSVTAALSDSLKTLSGSFTWTYAGNTHCTGTTTFHAVKQ